MYDELVKELRDSAEWADRLALPMGRAEGDTHAPIMRKAAEAIEELKHQVFLADLACKAEAAKAPRWIPVTERLPEDIDEEVLVCTEDYGVSGLGFVTVATYGTNGWLECWERKTYLTAVTHWMPLPLPPKEET